MTFLRRAESTPDAKNPAPGRVSETFQRISGGRYRDRTCDPYHVKVVLYR